MFRRRSSESIDEAMSRFETLRNRVRQSAPGFDLPVPVTTWLLLEAVYMPRQMWPLVLAPFNQTFPETEVGLGQVIESLRHQGHVAEHIHAGAHSWQKGGGGGHHFMDPSANDCSTWSFFAPPGAPPADQDSWPARGDSWRSDQDSNEAFVTQDQEGLDFRAVCGSCDDADDYHDTDTEDEGEFNLAVDDQAAYLGDLSGANEETLLWDYHLAKRRY